MNTLFCFGDSLTEGHPTHTTYELFLKWKEHRGGNLPDSWPEILSYELNYKLQNFGNAGNSNQQIFDDLAKNSHLFKKDDIVIVNWTYKHRFRWGHNPIEEDWAKDFDFQIENTNHRWRKMGSNNNNKNDLHYINQKTKEDIILNRTTYKCYDDEIYNYENLLEELAISKSFDIYFWSVDNELIYNLPKDEVQKIKYILHNDILEITKTNQKTSNEDFIRYIKSLGGKTIAEETNFEIQDQVHFGELGHKIQAHLFYDYIIKNKSKNRVIKRKPKLKKKLL